MSDDLIFPNKRSVKRAKSDAIKMAKAEGCKLHVALDRIAEEYGMKGFTWAEAVEHLSKKMTIILKCPWCGLDGKMPVVGVSNWQELQQMAVPCTKCKKIIGLIPNEGTVNCVALEKNAEGVLQEVVDGPIQMIVTQHAAEYGGGGVQTRDLDLADRVVAKIENVSTLENAKKYQKAKDKEKFCLDLVGLDPTKHDNYNCSGAFSRLSSEFDELLESD